MQTNNIFAFFMFFTAVSVGIKAEDLDAPIPNIKMLLQNKDVEAAYNLAKIEINKPNANTELRAIYYNIVDIIANNLARNHGFKKSVDFVKSNLVNVKEEANLEYFIKKMAYLYALDHDWKKANIVSKNYLQNRNFNRFHADMLYMLALSLDKQNQAILAKLAYEKFNKLYPNHQKASISKARSQELGVQVSGT